MVRRSFFLLGLLATPSAAQFGVPKQKGGGTSFQDLQERAKKGGDMAPLGAMDLDALANMNADDLNKLLEEVMNDPSLMETMGEINAGVASAMDELANMDPETLQRQMMEGLEMLTSGDIMKSVLGNKDEVLETLASQGLVDAEKLAAYRSDPALFEKEMNEAFGQMKEIFSNEDTLKAATQMMKGMSEVMSDPEAAMKKFAASMSGVLDDDDKIEEARLQLLSSPDKAGSPLLAEMFKGEEMREILMDPVKWREQVKKGQGMLTGEGGGVGAGAGVGEL
eukprot:CAMPEP_0183291504 /NCGR_PEP_ID=MMETSP0160_2-20130417/900_1 /TAXON_ID=2839 ORGANISM="Odontella Sinensis, Strain Grunow 1884" /NCGR_SAMPLE_ID=MMETSP0160_2 /ASSEMBLY_ACC=CAM_ASM_000250 /LENGTH=279 /DNA_ID=CAMNT_0025452321 /DNA_START=89 /DNA_END=928 /DNA_ORIENTATION=+